jgi:hypothetical protein
MNNLVLQPSAPPEQRPLLQTNVNRGRLSATSSAAKTRGASAKSRSPVRHVDTQQQQGQRRVGGPMALPEYADAQALLAAAARGDVQVFQRLRAVDPLLTHGFENIRDFSGRTLLHIAAWHGQTAILETLLRVANSASPLLNVASLTSKNGNNVLHSAVQGGHPATVEWLSLHPGLQTLISSRNARGLLPIDCAVQAGFADVVAVFQGRR